MFGQEPPPPRFVLHLRTGKWCRRPRPAACGATAAKPLQNSLDYFLREAMHAPVPPAAGGRAKASPAALLRQVDAFEARHLARNRPSHSTHLSATDANPIIGLLAGVPLHDVYAELVHCKAFLWQQRGHFRHQASFHAEVRLHLDELCDICARLVRDNMVSREYVGHMIESLPGYSEAGESVPLFNVFSFLVEHGYHPQLHRNTSAIFRAFDPDGTGRIAAATLTPTVMTAWAELNLFGKLRSNWEKVAGVVEAVGGVDLRITDGAPLLTPEMTRAVLCTSAALYSAVTLTDMEGSHPQVAG